MIADQAKKNHLFTRTLLRWEKKNTRAMPWKGEKDPYKIWLSEIILQQTRVEQGKPYYERFIQKYPTVTDLAKAEEQEVFRLWQGLGYYNRCKNMLAAAHKIVIEHQGKFPGIYEHILALPGVGEYTAAAIASFAFGLPYAVVDGNVQRVLARFFGIREAVNNGRGKKIFASLAQEVLEKKNPAVWNQAIMDFGATVCTPQKPDCTTCLLQKDCFAFQQKMVNRLPIKTIRAKVIKRYFTYVVISGRGKVYIHKRSGQDIWQNLYEFPLFEENEFSEISEFLQKKAVHDLLHENSTKCFPSFRIYKQPLTHQIIYARFLHIKIKTSQTLPKNIQNDFFPVSTGELKRYAFPKIILEYMIDTNFMKNLK
ncbi:MAG: A/G-specific adenine glycosylase [Chitinophagaceae bacterium]|nr:MAG: A/G-specific adenine glycosylase [Chitinophagaceae bacterium]